MTRRSRILIVEDESVIAMLLEAHLSDQGYEVIGTAATSQEALDLATAVRPDLVLMDINIRGPRDGVDTANDMRMHFGTAVLFLTAYADSETVQRAKATGPFGYLLKPFRPDELTAAIEVAIHTHSMVQEEKTAVLRDKLTGLYGPAFLDEVMPRDIEAASRFGIPLSVVLLGIDRLDGYRKSSGQEAADMALKEVGQILQMRLRKGASAYRIDADHFCVVLPNVKAADAARDAGGWSEEFDRNFAKAGAEIRLTLSAGVAQLPENGPVTAKDLMHRAHTALAESRSRGGNMVSISGSGAG